MAFDPEKYNRLLYNRLSPADPTESQVRECVALAGGVCGEIETGTATLYSCDEITIFRTRRLPVHNDPHSPPVEMIFLGQTKEVQKREVHHEPLPDTPVVTLARQSNST